MRTKKLLFALYLFCCWKASYAGYTNYYTFTIDHTKIVVGNQTNYVLTISGTYAQFATAANGGDIQHTTTCCANTETVPADLIFTTTQPPGNGTCTKNLDWDIPYYVATTGAIEVHVGPIATVSSTVNTLVYACTKNAAVTTYQSTYTSTWPAIFNTVYHFGDLTTLDLHDSTINGNTATNHGATLGTGIMGGGLATDGSSSKYINVAGMPSGNVRRAILLFFKGTVTGLAVLFDMGTLVANGRWVMLKTPGSPDTLNVDTDGHNTSVSCASCADGNWHMAVSQQSDLVSNVIILLDTVSSSLPFGTPNTTATPQLISQSIGGGNGLNGTIDEAEIFNDGIVVVGYAGTRYNNIKSPSTFYSVSGSSPIGSSGSIHHKSTLQ